MNMKGLYLILLSFLFGCEFAGYADWEGGLLLF